jgi:hypothetical protein
MNNQEPWHPGINQKGKILNWLPSDTQEYFEKNIADPEQQEYLAQQGWSDPTAIEYSINNHGFRSDQFLRDHPCMIALGCSFTVGIGLPHHQVWPWILGAALNLRVYNLAWGGASTDTCFRMADYWIPQLNPQLVCMLTPPSNRFELLTASGPWPAAEVIMPNTSTVLENLKNDTFVKHWWTNELNARFNSRKNKLAIEMIASKNSAPIVIFDVDTESSMRPHIHGYARDFLHVGPSGHQELAKKMLAKLNKPQ